MRTTALNVLDLLLEGTDDVFDRADVPHIGQGESLATVLIMIMTTS